ncbi:MAG: RNA polymerase sigma factor [Planctomycetes bacterium]|nr:RNA polymerase sigma factor [Planctomycetota bacterium]
MQVTDSHYADPPFSGEDLSGRLGERLRELGTELSANDLARMLAVLADGARTPESVRDALSTRLMEAFRLGAGRGAFGLLYELNSDHLLVQVASRLRRYTSKADPRDVLQEVFFNIYRYPHRFNAERDDAFRVWSAMIVRNTVLKHLRSQGHGGRSEIAIEDLSGEPEVAATSPLHSAVERESRQECERVYLTYLHLYLRFYSMLSERERKALQLVEVEERSYREAAEELGIKLENLKMVIFRARRKIHRSMRRVFDGLSPDCRPAREPRSAGEESDSSRLSDEATDDRQEVDEYGR